MVWELFLKAHKFHIETFDSTLNANLKTKLKQKQKFAEFSLRECCGP